MNLFGKPWFWVVGLTLWWNGMPWTQAAEPEINTDLITTNNLPINHWFTNTVELDLGPDDGKIAKWTARILARTHYRQQPFNDDISTRLLDRYLDTLDPQHLLFLQTDVAEFDAFRTSLDDLTLILGDPKPALDIFNRFLKRVDQQAAFVKERLQHDTFEFNTDERYTVIRRKLPRPKDLEEAKTMWRDRLRYEYLQEKLNQDKPEEILKTISRRYERMQRYLKEYDSSNVLEIYLTALAHVYDPHSDYMGKSQMENFNIGMRLSLFGIGAVLRSEDGYCKIQELVPGGPAARSKKLKPNDRIIAVAQSTNEAVDIVDMKLDKAVELIRGPKDTEVRLTVIPAAATDPSTRKVVVLIRDKINLEEREAKAKIIEFNGAAPLRIGVIDLPSFYAEFPSPEKSTDLKSTTDDVAKLLEKIKQENVRGIVLDLRQNGGGSLEEAIRLTGLFIKEGPVVLSKDPFGNITPSNDPDPALGYEGPMVVLTSRFSASASEILAGALQDYGRAVIVGDCSTFGKGTVQQLLQLEPVFNQFNIRTRQDPGALKITIRKFYRANGSSTQLKGIIPDIVLPSANEYAEMGEASLPDPLPWDAIPAPVYEPMDLVTPFLAELKTRSSARMAKDEDFLFLQKDIERFKQAMADKSVSMNEAQRRQEKQADDARKKARNAALRQRPAPAYQVYELTVKQAALPGMPAPVAPTNQVAQVDAASESPVADPAAEAEEEDLPAVDVYLNEAKRVLLDLISLSSRKPAVSELVQLVQ